MFSFFFSNFDQRETVERIFSENRTVFHPLHFESIVCVAIHHKFRAASSASVERKPRQWEDASAQRFWQKFDFCLFMTMPTFGF